VAQLAGVFGVAAVLNARGAEVGAVKVAAIGHSSPQFALYGIS
jgi:hypothetical protein